MGQRVAHDFMQQQLTGLTRWKIPCTLLGISQSLIDPVYFAVRKKWWEMEHFVGTKNIEKQTAGHRNFF